ncbi:hypothetical protein NC652_014602 [Populus alba x Populus x berolinensis]|nr:hypothetical protein NC652_014602 [Populus alba x Populus x berolinensis]
MAGCETCVPEILMALAWYYYKGRKGTRNILKCLYSGLGFGGLSGRKSNATLDFSMCVCTNRSDGAPNLIGFQFSFFSHHGDIENFIAILFDDGDGYLKNEFSLLSGSFCIAVNRIEKNQR